MRGWFRETLLDTYMMIREVFAERNTKKGQRVRSSEKKIREVRRRRDAAREKGNDGKV